MLTRYNRLIPHQRKGCYGPVWTVDVYGYVLYGARAPHVAQCVRRWGHCPGALCAGRWVWVGSHHRMHTAVARQRTRVAGTTRADVALRKHLAFVGQWCRHHHAALRTCWGSVRGRRVLRFSEGSRHHRGSPRGQWQCILCGGQEYVTWGFPVRAHRSKESSVSSTTRSIGGRSGRNTRRHASMPFCLAAPPAQPPTLSMTWYSSSGVAPALWAEWT